MTCRVAPLADRVREIPWYHTISLPGEVVTPGFYDTLTAATRVPLPGSLAGKRCLDIGTCDGFWAFELERRGAAEVVGIDLDDPDERDWPGLSRPGSEEERRSSRAFALAAEALDSRVERLDLSIYELSPERVGSFDFVFLGNLLLHLRDPVGALMATRSVVGGELMCVDAVSLATTIASPRTPAARLSRRPIPYWWIPNLAAFRQYFPKAGLRITDTGRPFFIPFGPGYHPRPPLRDLARSPSLAFFWGAIHPLGSPSAWVKAEPLDEAQAEETDRRPSSSARRASRSS